MKRFQTFFNDRIFMAYKYIVPFFLISQVILFLSSIILFLSSGVLSNLTAAINCIIEITTMVFVILLYVYCGYGKLSDHKKEDFFFLFCIISNFINCWEDCVVSSLEGLYGYTQIIKVLIYLQYVAIGGYSLFYVLYYKSVLSNKRKIGVFSFHISIFCIILSFFMPVYDMFFPSIFCVTENGVVVYSSKLSIVSTLMIITSIFEFIYIITSTNRRKHKFLFAINGFALFFELVIDSLWISHMKVNFIGIENLFTVIMFYILTFNFYIDEKELFIKSKAELSEARTSMMISQIQPHFLYNILGSISALCDINPSLAKEATNTFSDYLRENMESIDLTTPILIEKEIRHVKEYVWLEKLRFGQRINVQYNISQAVFSIPVLSIQPIVENAIKHGLCPKKEGGTVIITTGETNEYFYVTIEDDGIGFDTEKSFDSERKHVGIQNVRARLSTMINGDLIITSKIGSGTKAMIVIPKNPYKNHLKRIGGGESD